MVPKARPSLVLSKKEVVIKDSGIKFHAFTTPSNINTTHWKVTTLSHVAGQSNIFQQDTISGTVQQSSDIVRPNVRHTQSFEPHYRAVKCFPAGYCFWHVQQSSDIVRPAVRCAQYYSRPTGYHSPLYIGQVISWLTHQVFKPQSWSKKTILLRQLATSYSRSSEALRTINHGAVNFLRALQAIRLYKFILPLADNPAPTTLILSTEQEKKIAWISAAERQEEKYKLHIANMV